MIEPTTPALTSISLLGLLIGLLGVKAGPYAFLLFGALAGGWTALRTANTQGTWEASRFLLGRMSLAMLFTFPVSWLAYKLWTDAPIEVVLLFSSYLIGWQWGWLTEEALLRLKSLTKGSTP